MTQVHSRSRASTGAHHTRVPGGAGGIRARGPEAAGSRSGSHGHTRTASMLNQNSFTIMDKSKFQARHDLLTTRSDSYLLRPREVTEDIWKRPPPDFTLQRYMPNPPKRNTRESMQPWRWGCVPGEKKAVNVAEKPAVTLPKILQPPRPGSAKMLTKFRIADPDTARKEAVKTLVHPREPFKNPMPHDFRQYPALGPLGLDEFVTNKEKDPYNIKFKRENLDIVYGLPIMESDRFNGIQMGRDVLKQPPKFDSEMMHPKGKWPSPSGEFSRYRARNRSPTTVLMDNVEATLSKRWAHEKKERQRRKKEQQEAEQRRAFDQKVAREVADVDRQTKALAARDNEFGEWHDHLLRNSRGGGGGGDRGSMDSTPSSSMSSNL